MRIAAPCRCFSLAVVPAGFGVAARVGSADCFSCGNLALFCHAEPSRSFIGICHTGALTASHFDLCPQLTSLDLSFNRLRFGFPSARLSFSEVRGDCLSFCCSAFDFVDFAFTCDLAVHSLFVDRFPVLQRSAAESGRLRRENDGARLQRKQRCVTAVPRCRGAG